MIKTDLPTKGIFLSALALILTVGGFFLFRLIQSAQPQAAQPQASPTSEWGEIRVSPINSMAQIYIPAGEFLMGTAANAVVAPDEEEPQRTFYLDAYWIDQTLVTNEMWRKCVAAGGCRKYGNPSGFGKVFNDPQFKDHPVVYINWFDAEKYCQWAGGHLPTEAQWEKAARGTDGRLYPWGNNPPNPLLLNFNNPKGTTTVTGNYLDGASPYAVLDMAGNVREWVQDWYTEFFFQQAPDRNPTGPPDGGTEPKKVLKGGSYLDPDKYVRSASRLAHEPKSAGINRGFRCAYVE